MDNIETQVVPIRVLICDDHPIMRYGLREAISIDPAIAVVGEAGDGGDAIVAFRDLMPDVTLMDIQMPVLDGLGAIQAIREEFAAARIIVLTTYPDDARIARALELGAISYLVKTARIEEIVRAIRIAWSTPGSAIGDDNRTIVRRPLDNALTSRELAVLRLVAEGNGNRSIALQLQISEDTVKSRLRSIAEKLGARDRTHAVLLAVRRGFIEP